MPLAAPGMRHVARMELPSTRAATIRLRSSALSWFTCIVCLTAHDTSIVLYTPIRLYDEFHD